MIWPGIRLFPDVAPSEPLFGFTVLEPFGSAIIEHDKRIENRSKPPPERLRSRAFWIAIHTGARLYPELDRGDFTSTSLFHRDPYNDAQHPALWPGCPPFASFRQRVVLGAARVVGAVPDATLSAHQASRAVDRDRWAMRDQWHWLLDPTVVRLPEPFPWAKGELGLWAPKPASRPDHDRDAAIQDERAAAFLRLRDALRAAMRDPTNLLTVRTPWSST